MENLNKYNFWNRIFETYPEACKIFCYWIDNYKKENNWDEIFGDKIKYHHLPIAMQMGIFIEFSVNDGGCSWETDLFEFDLPKEIEEWMKFTQQNIETLKY